MAYSTASVQHQYAIDAHQHNATVSLTLRRRQNDTSTSTPSRRHALIRTRDDAHSTEQNRWARPSETTVRAVGLLHAAQGFSSGLVRTCFIAACVCVLSGVRSPRRVEPRRTAHRHQRRMSDSSPRSFATRAAPSASDAIL